MDITEYYNNLSEELKRTFRTIVCEKLSIGYSTFYYRLRATYRWKEHEYKIIKRIINELQ